MIIKFKLSFYVFLLLLASGTYSQDYEISYFEKNTNKAGRLEYFGVPGNEHIVISNNEGLRVFFLDELYSTNSSSYYQVVETVSISMCKNINRDSNLLSVAYYRQETLDSISNIILNFKETSYDADSIFNSWNVYGDSLEDTVFYSFKINDFPFSSSLYFNINTTMICVRSEPYFYRMKMEKRGNQVKLFGSSIIEEFNCFKLIDIKF